MSAGLPPLRPADAGYSDRTVTYPKLRSLPSVRFYKSYDSSFASSGQPEPTRQPSTIGVGFAFLLAVRQRLSRLALLSPAASVARMAERRGGKRTKRS